MEKEIKKKLVRNWFKILQDMICNEISELENNKIFRVYLKNFVDLY